MLFKGSVQFSCSVVSASSSVFQSRCHKGKWTADGTSVLCLILNLWRELRCLENPMDGGAWWAAVHGVEKSWTRLSDFTFTFHFHALEKEMATHSSILAWRIPGTGEPRGLLSMGSQRVRHDWIDLAAAAAAAAADLGMTGAKITTLQSVNVDQLNFWFEGDLAKEG